jgi:hypothetical protein
MVMRRSGFWSRLGGIEGPTEARKEYHLRSSIEERYRQLKCFVDLAGFRSCTFSLVANQVVFIMLAYNLLPRRGGVTSGTQ